MTFIEGILIGLVLTWKILSLFQNRLDLRPSGFERIQFGGSVVNIAFPEGIARTEGGDSKGNICFYVYTTSSDLTVRVYSSNTFVVSI